MSSKNIKTEIFSAVSLCGYPPNVTDSLIELITQIMNYPYVKSSPQYKIKTINQEKIIAVRCPMEIPFNKKNYEVPIVIFFSKFIPLEPPKVFLEVSKGSAINPKTKDVDLNTRKILTPSLRSWNQFSNIINILNEIKNCFSKVFPIYKIKKNQTNDGIDSRPTLNTINFNNNRNDPFHKTINTININNNEFFNFVSNNNINDNKINDNKRNNNISPNNDPFANIASIFTENFLNNQNNNTGINITYNNTFQNMNNNNNNNNNNNILNLKTQGNQNINRNLNNFMNLNQLNIKDNNNIKNILIESVFDKISSKLFFEYKKLNQQNKTLNNYKNQFKTENIKMEKYILKKQDITNECTKDLYHLNNEIKKYNEYINKNKDNKITEQNCLKFIKIESPSVLKAIANEINYEELIILIKKGFEKNKITFNEAISSIRNTSRELFISKIIRDKGLKNIVNLKK